MHKRCRNRILAWRSRSEACLCSNPPDRGTSRPAAAGHALEMQESEACLSLAIRGLLVFEPAGARDVPARSGRPCRRDAGTGFLLGARDQRLALCSNPLRARDVPPSLLVALFRLAQAGFFWHS